MLYDHIQCFFNDILYDTRYYVKEIGTDKAEKSFSFIEWVVSEISEILTVSIC